MPKSDLYDEILAAQKGSKAKCNVALVLAKLADTDQTALKTAIADEGVYGITICRILAKRGIDMSVESMRRHRRGECQCSKGDA